MRRVALEYMRAAVVGLIARIPRRKATTVERPFLAPSVESQSRSELDEIATRIDILQVAIDALRVEQKETRNELSAIDVLQRANRQATQDVLDRLERHDLTNSSTCEEQFDLRSNVRTLAERSDKILSRSGGALGTPVIALGTEALFLIPSGVLLVPCEDHTLIGAVWTSRGVLEPGTIRVLTALLRDGDWAIDVGAHIGMTVIPAARKVGSGGRVIALEPSSRTGDILQQNIALNFLADRVSFHPQAAGATAGRGRLHVGKILGHSSLLPIAGSEQSEEVEVRTVDSIVPPGRAIRLVKIDAEAYELQVWRGMSRIIAESPELVAIVEFGPEHIALSATTIADWLAEFQAPGFTAYEIDEKTGSVAPLRAIEELSAVYSLNLLLLRQPLTAYPI